MKIVVVTQYCENYAFPDWDGEGECPDGWKYKGGSTYVLQNVKVTEACDRDQLMKLVNDFTDHIVYANPASQEYVINWHLLDDDEDIGIDEWQTPTMVQRVNGEFKATESRTDDYFSGLPNDVERIDYTYTMLLDGERKDTERTVVYKKAA